MPHIRNTIQIDVSPDKVWAVLGDLAGTRDWLPGVTSAIVDGNTRICVMADGNQIHEEITHYSDDTRSYRFRQLRTPLPVRDLYGQFTVTGDPLGPTQVTLDTDVEPADPAAADQLAAMIDTAFGQALAALRRWIEQQQRWDAA